MPDLTPRPPSLGGKGEIDALQFHGEALDDGFIEFDAESGGIRHGGVAIDDGDGIARQELPEGRILHAVFEEMRLGYRREQGEGGGDVDVRREGVVDDLSPPIEGGA